MQHITFLPTASRILNIFSIFDLILKLHDMSTNSKPSKGVIIAIAVIALMIIAYLIWAFALGDLMNGLNTGETEAVPMK
ncbi:hypothetical protein [Cruoricaptor ignavus]|nr:hypothetical protein [Cruoricaptor ignavus]